jgi:hypothetical protein
VKRAIFTICLAAAALQAQAAIYSSNDVATGGSVTVFTAAKKPIRVTSATISPSDCGNFVLPATRQVLAIGGTPITGYLGTGAGHSFTINFTPAVIVKPGDSLTFSNGDSSCKTSVTVQTK